MAKTHDDYVKELSIINPEIEVIGKYTRAVDRIEVLCKKCGLQWHPQAYRLIQGIGCPECGKQLAVENRKGKTAKKSTKEFVQELHCVNTNVTITGEYTGSKNKINCLCNSCGHKWAAIPYLLLNGSRCPNCIKLEKANYRRYTPESYKEKLFQINPHIELLSDFTKSTEVIEAKCNRCGNVWFPKAFTLLQGRLCPKCAHKIGALNNHGKTGLKPYNVFIEELSRIDNSIEVVSKYINTHTNISCRCKRCNHIWSVEPYALLQGHGCPRCTKSGTSFMEQLILLSFQKVCGRENVLSRDKSLIEMELDIFIPSFKLAIEPGNWFLHKGSIKRDAEKRLRCKEKGVQLITIYDKYPKDAEPPFSEDCYVFHDDLNTANHSVIHSLIYELFSRCKLVKSFSDVEWRVLEEQAYENSKSLTHEEFVKKLFAISPDINIIGKYKNANLRLAVKCMKCGFAWDGIPANLLAGDGCRKCGAKNRGGNARRKQEDFENELNNLISTVKVIGEYIGRHKPIKVQCLNCGTIWEPTAGSLLRKGYINSDNNGCPICSKSKKGTPKKKVLNIETGEVFDSAAEAGKQYGTVPSAIRQCCRGKSKSSNGYHWKYIE